MRPIEPADLLARLLPQRLRWFTEVRALLLGEDVRCHENDAGDCFAMEWHYPYGPFVSLLGREGPPLDRAFCREILGQFPQADGAFVLPPDVPPPKACPFAKDGWNGLTFGTAYRCFAGKPSADLGAPEAPADPRIRPLAGEEHALLLPFTRHPAELEEPGLEVLAWFEGGRLCGHIRFAPAAADIWDVGLIHTLPEHRGRGIATALARAYRQTIRARGLTPYYSGVSNPHSARAARKAGFSPCCARYAFQWKRPHTQALPRQKSS
ncbi:MAG: GNAT family N-acetyltransferase [Oscillospiraceae bacterium]|jgi:GNAT superfamily N-acetyltransferase|nr:GNAT family N-acetyltransferase [Oscillospiraceae bacterium]